MFVDVWQLGFLLATLQIEGVEASKAGLAQEIIALKREAARLNTPSTYAKCAKAQRQANAKEKELAALSNAKKTWADHVALGCAWGKVRVHGTPFLHAVPCKGKVLGRKRIQTLLSHMHGSYVPVLLCVHTDGCCGGRWCGSVEAACGASATGHGLAL